METDPPLPQNIDRIMIVEQNSGSGIQVAAHYVSPARHTQGMIAGTSI
jgi:hypothetical protein